MSKRLSWRLELFLSGKNVIKLIVRGCRKEEKGVHNSENTLLLRCRNRLKTR